MAETLTWPTRLRVAARVALTRALRAVPPGVSATVRTRYAEAAGARRTALGLAVSVLRHRPLAPLDTFTLIDNPAVRLAAVENRMVKRLYWYGEHGWEGVETDWWKRFCRQADRILEAGANVGYYTVQGALAAPGARYVAVEANPESAAVVRRNVALNALDNVEVVEAAVVGTDGVDSVQLALPDQERYVAPTGAYLVDLREGIRDRPAHRTVTVPAVHIRDLAADADLVKLDIEGMEHDVLEPIAEDLVRRRAVVFVEVLTDTPKLRQLLVRVAEGDYRLYVIGKHALTEVPAQMLRDVNLEAAHGGRDLIVLPAEKVDLVAALV
jgi:FkbM family methyltransferase